MPFQFGGPKFPMPLKVSRSLIGVQVVLFFFVAALWVLAQVINASSSSGAGSNTTVTGAGSSPAVAAVFVVVGLVLVYLAVDLRRLRVSTRNAIVAIEAVIMVAYLVSLASDLQNSWFSILLMACIVAGIIYCMFAPSSRAAFAASETSKSDVPVSDSADLASAEAKSETSTKGEVTKSADTSEG